MIQITRSALVPSLRLAKEARFQAKSIPSRKGRE
jgi:hypothetical protein